MVVTGRVVKKPFAVGSKSERQAVVLQASDGHEYLLRRRGGNAYYDEALDALVGHTIQAEGQPHGYTFLMDTWRVTT